MSRLAPADAVWLHMEHPTNLMTVACVLVLDQPLNIHRLKATIESRLLPFKRFRQRVRPTLLPPGSYAWEDDPHFDLNAHIHRIALPDAADQTALRRTVNDLVCQPLDKTKPLWQIHLLENYRGATGEDEPTTALLVRLHHCIADGMALIYVTLSLMDDSPDAEWPVPDENADRRPTPSFLQNLFNTTADLVGKTTAVAQTTATTGFDLLQNPQQAVELAGQAGDLAQNLGRMLSTGADRQTGLKGKLGIAKTVAWSAPISLKEVKRLAKAHGGTVNDLILTLYTGALRHELSLRGEPVDDFEIRTVIPVTLRPVEQAHKLGNEIGSVTLTLPIDVADFWTRFSILKERMDALKQSPDAVITAFTSNLIGLAPKPAASKIVEIFYQAASVILTNVPGPQQPLYLAGCEIKNLMVWGPLGGRLGLGASLLSYNGTITLGIFADEGLVPNPDNITQYFSDEFNSIL